MIHDWRYPTGDGRCGCEFCRTYGMEFSPIEMKPTNQFRYIIGAFVAAILLHVALMIAVNL